MAYDFYLKKCLLPVPPEKMQVKINSANKTLTLINEGQVNILKTPGLTDIEFECMIPQVEYPFATYKKKFKSADYFLDYFKKLKTDQKPFQFLVSRALPNGTVLVYTNIKVSLEDYTVTENAKDGFDFTVKIKLKQYRKYGTQTVKTTLPSSGKAKVTKKKTRSTETAPDTSSTQTYTVRDGDCLWGIARKFYGDGSKWKAIYNANKDKIGSSYTIYEGMVLTIPDAKTAASSSSSTTSTSSSSSSTTKKTSGEYKGTGGSKTNPPFAILGSDYGVVKVNIKTWSEAMGYYYVKSGKTKGWHIMDGSNRKISF
jgi:nucleoid-associated protein YgaU